MSDASPARDDPGLRRSLRQWEWAGLFMFLLLVVAFPVYRAVDSSRRVDAVAERQAALVSLGEQLWGLNCASCHGIDGEGVDAPALNAKEFLDATADAQIHRIVAAGISGTEMPAWWNEFGGPLTDEQIAAVVAYLRSWQAAAPSRPDWRSAFVGGEGTADHAETG